MMNRRQVDALFLWLALALLAFGSVIFMSAAFGLLARDGAPLTDVAVRHFLAVAVGLVAAYIASRVDYRLFRRFAFPLLLLSCGVALLVFVPGIGFAHGGAQRWIAIGPLTLQPSELLKFAFVAYAAAYLAGMKEQVRTVWSGLVPIAALSAIAGAVLLLQPDTDTFLIITAAIMAMFLAAGGKASHCLVVVLIGVIGFSALVMERPYLKERLSVFLNPAADPLGGGYQIQQSQIAIGSGGLFGKGFGQGVQKFSYLPEPIGDSIFAVAGEEFGFAGGAALVLLFSAFILRGFKIAVNAPDRFGGLLALGIVILIGASAFLNIAAMLAIVPLSGLTLPFVSHGGTAIVFNLAEVGVILGMSRFQRA